MDTDEPIIGDQIVSEIGRRWLSMGFTLVREESSHT